MSRLAKLVFGANEMADVVGGECLQDGLQVVFPPHGGKLVLLAFLCFGQIPNVKLFVHAETRNSVGHVQLLQDFLLGLGGHLGSGNVEPHQVKHFRG